MIHRMWSTVCTVATKLVFLSCMFSGCACGFLEGGFFFKSASGGADAAVVAPVNTPTQLQCLWAL